MPHVGKQQNGHAHNAVVKSVTAPNTYKIKTFT